MGQGAGCEYHCMNKSSKLVNYLPVDEGLGSSWWSQTALKVKNIVRRIPLQRNKNIQFLQTFQNAAIFLFV